MKRKNVIKVVLLSLLLVAGSLGSFYLLNKEKIELLSMINEDNFYDFNASFLSLSSDKQNKYSKDIAEKIIVDSAKSFVEHNDKRLESLINAKKNLQLDRDSWQGEVITSFDENFLYALKYAGNTEDPCYKYNQDINKKVLDKITEAATDFANYMTYDLYFYYDKATDLVSETYSMNAKRGCSNSQEVENRINRFTNLGSLVWNNVNDNNYSSAKTNIKKIIDSNNAYLSSLEENIEKLDSAQKSLDKWSSIQDKYENKINNPGIKYNLLKIFY